MSERVGVCVLVRACSLAYPAYNAYAPNFDVICKLLVHHIFRHYFINGTIFETEVIEHKTCVEVELFHADGETDMTKVIVAFVNFANAPKNLCILLIIRKL
jgi:hypothetical protein